MTYLKQIAVKPIVYATPQKETCSVARKPRDAAAVVFGLKFADNIHYTLKSSQASKARLQSSKRTGAKQNLTQNGHSRSSKVTYFGVSGRAGFTLNRALFRKKCGAPEYSNRPTATAYSSQ